MSNKRGHEDEPRGPDAHGVRVVRPSRPAHAELFDPRDPAWDELVAAYRRALLARGGHEPTPEQGATAARRLPEFAPKGLGEELSSAPYRYSKGPDFTNDSLGYGEVLQEPLWWVVEGGVVSQTRTSQRTKSGKQLLRAGALQAAPAPREPSLSAQAAHVARTLPEQASLPRRRVP